MESSRKPSGGVILIAILALLGSAIVLLMGIVMLVIPLIVPVTTADSPLTPGFFKAMMLVGSLFYLGPAIWGILTGIGLFRLQEWARISTIVFSVLLVLMMGFGGLFMLFIPIPTPPNQSADPAVTHGIRVFMGVFSLLLVSLGVWWLIFFNRAKVKQQFAATPVAVAGTADLAAVLVSDSAPVIARGPQRPLSLTIIAWLLLVGCVFVPLNFVWHGPAIFLTQIITGWGATVYFLAFAAMHLYIGIGLLRLKPRARTAGVAYYLFIFVNTAVFYLAPGGRSRMMDLMQRADSMFPWTKGLAARQEAIFLDSGPFFWFMRIIGLAAIFLPLYFLITRKEAYERAAVAARAVESASTSG